MRPWLRVPLWIVAGGILSCWVALAALHVDDDYRVGHNGGTWAALAETARAGRLYPPIFDGEHYAGTRYMPLPILLNALASGVAGDPLIGGKVLAWLLMLALMGLVIFVLHRVLCPWPIATALAAEAQPIIAAVGPEGGFSPAELAAARAAGWQAVSLGTRILRVETAAVTMAAWAGIPNC